MQMQPDGQYSRIFPRVIGGDTSGSELALFTAQGHEAELAGWAEIWKLCMNNPAVRDRTLPEKGRFKSAMAVIK